MIAVALVLLSAALGYWVTVRGQKRPLPPPPAPSPGAEAILANPELSYRDKNGHTAWRVLLDSLELESGGNTLTAKGLREGIVYDEKGTPVVRITAQQVTADTNRKDFSVTGKVTVVSPKGMILTTERADWINDLQTVRAPGPVVMRTKSIVITATGLDYNIKTDQVTSPNQVRVYSGNNRLVGRGLKYDLNTGWVDLANVQVVVNPSEGKRILQELGNP
jgi:LPS export ABC transporter protein LptC